MLPSKSPGPARGTGIDVPPANAVTLTTFGVVRTTALTTVPERTTVGLTLAPRIYGNCARAGILAPARAVAGGEDPRFAALLAGRAAVPRCAAEDSLTASAAGAERAVDRGTATAGRVAVVVVAVP